MAPVAGSTTADSGWARPLASHSSLGAASAVADNRLMARISPTTFRMAVCTSVVRNWRPGRSQTSPQLELRLLEGVSVTAINLTFHHSCHGIMPTHCGRRVPGSHDVRCVIWQSLVFEQRRAHWSLLVRGTTPVDLLLFVPIQFRQLSAFLAVGRTTTALVGP